jgi:hemerythrin
MGDSWLHWNNSFLVNFEIIDNQHKGLVDMINELILGCEGGKVTQDVLKQLRAFEENRNNPAVLVGFLRDWLFTHIAVSDKKYAPCLAGLSRD